MDWVAVVQVVGFPAAVLVAVGLAGWRVIVWTGREVVIPCRDNLLSKAAAFFERENAALSAMEKRLDRMAIAAERQADAAERQAEATTRIDQLCRSEHCDLQAGIDSILRKD